jgi:UDP-N-acetylglucosamine transferase subunit ALG13
MILVTTGTTAPPFDRLLREVERLTQHESVIVQHGPSVLRPTGATCIDYISFDQFVELVRAARVVVTHAGVGSILVSLMNGKRPFVVPRLARFGEHVDDHQLELGRRLNEIGVVTLIEDPTELESAIRGEVVPQRPPAVDQLGQLVDHLAEYLDSIVNGSLNRGSTERSGSPSFTA